MGVGFRCTGYGSWASRNTLNPTYDLYPANRAAGLAPVEALRYE